MTSTSARLRRLAAALLAALAALAASGCGRAEPDRPRAVVIGIDGADWRVIDPLIARGRMPQLAALRERGSSGPIQTLSELPISPVVWTSVATGKLPTKHGVTWFLVDQPDGSQAPVRSHNRRVKAIWNLAADHGLTPVVVGWWATYPAEDVGPGVVVSDALGFHGFGRSARAGEEQLKTHPKSLFREVDALIPAEQQISPAFAARFLHIDPDEYRERRFDPGRSARADPGNPIHLFQQYAVTAQGYTAIAEELLARHPYDLFLLYFEQVDSLSHLFMKHASPRLDWVEPAEFERYRDVVDEWYAYQDELLGRLLAQIDLETTAVFVLSDHGFKSGERRIRSERSVDLRTAHLDHEPDGILLASGPGIRRGARVEGASVLDVTPTLLHYLGLAVGKDMDGAVLEDLFEPELRERRPLRYVTSYEVAPAVTASDADAHAAAELDANAAALETLGYLRPVAEDSPPGEPGEPPPHESSPEIHNNLGLSLLAAGELERARAEFQAALELDAQNADALLHLATIARIQGNATHAEHLVKQALRADPDHSVALAQLAELTRDAGNLSESLRLYQETLALDDVNPGLHLGYGDVLQRAGRYDEAAAAFRRVLELDPDSFVAHYNLGVTALQQQRFAEAIASFERALALDPQHPLAAAALNNLGTVYLDMGDEQKATLHYERAVQSSPVQLEARYNLASLHLDAGRVDAAIPLLEQAVRLAPNHELVNAKLGLAYLMKGSGEEAFRTFTLVRRLHPDNWLAALGLAVLHAANGRAEQAGPLLADALRLGGDAAREEAASYPALQPLLAAHAAAP